MRLIRASKAAVGIAVLPLDSHEIEYNASICAYCSSDVSGITSKVDGTISDLGANIPVTYSQTTTSITVTFPAAQPHLLGSNVDYCTLSNTGVVGVDGTWQVASVTSNTVVVLTSTTSQTASGNAIAVPLRLYQNVIPTNAAATIVVPVVTTTSLYIPNIVYSALILNVTVRTTSGTAYCEVRQTGSGR